MSFLKHAAGLVLLVVMSTSALAQDEAEISSFTLDNGLEVVVVPDRRAPIVTHMIWYRVGSADEVAGHTGLAHFLEHLLFKGTEAYPGDTFSQRIAQIGGSENAFTSHDYTAYFQQIAPDALPEMMAMEADRMTGLILTDEVVDLERDVVIEERRARVENDPGALLSESVNATLFQNHPYGKPVIGWMHEIEELDRAQALEFYGRHYSPGNAVLVVTGDVEAEAVRTLAEETYGAIEAGEEAPERVRPKEPPQRASRTVSLSDPRVTIPSFQTVWVVPSYTRSEGGEAEALDLLAEILGGGIRSRLYQELVVRQGIAASTGAYYRGTALDDTAFTVYGTPRGEASREQVEEAIRDEVAKIVRDGITEDELERARNRFLRSIIFARDSQAGMARLFGATLTTGGTLRDITEWPERIRAVTAEDIQRAAERHLDYSRAVTGYLNPVQDERT